MWMFLMMGMATATISMAISRSKFFKPIRAALPDGWFKDLLTCPYCVSHWVAIGFGLILLKMWGTEDWPLAFFTSLALVPSAAIWSFLIYTCYSRMPSADQQQRRDKATANES